jgi:hypothetical protein
MGLILKKNNTVVSSATTTNSDTATLNEVKSALAAEVPFSEYSTGRSNFKKDGQYTERWIEFNPYTKGLPVRGGVATFATTANQLPCNIIGVYPTVSTHSENTTYYKPKVTKFAYVNTKLRFFDNFTPQYVTISLVNNEPTKYPPIKLIDRQFVNLDRNGTGRDYLPELNGNVYTRLYAGITYWIEVKFDSTVDNSKDIWYNEENKVQSGFKTKYSWTITENADK